MTVAYSPWGDLASRPDVRLERRNLGGALGWSEPGLIVVGDQQRRAQLRCTLAHELAHLDLGHHHVDCDATPDGDRIARRHEAEADQLAARRLIATEDLGDALQWAIDHAQLADELNVDEATVRCRLEHLHPAERAYLRRRLNPEGET